MDSEHLSALRQAATALIATAAASTVLAALRTLLADPAFAAAAPALPLRPAQPAAAPAVAPAPKLPAPRPAKPTAGAKSTATPIDPAWDELRHTVRQAMAERGLDYAGLGEAIGRSATAVRIELTCRNPARAGAQAKFRQWLANGANGAPEVAATGTTFPRNGASTVYTGNGLDTAA